MKIVLTAEEKGLYEKFMTKLIVMSGDQLVLEKPDYKGAQMKGLHNTETEDGGLEVEVATGYIEDVLNMADRIGIAFASIGFIVKPLLKELGDKMEQITYHWLAPDKKEEEVKSEPENKVA